VADADIRIHIIGVGSDGLAGLTSRARELLQAADVVLGSEQTLAALPELRAERVRLGSDLTEALRLLESYYGHKRLVLVASGDPLFYGVARYLCDKLGKDRFEVVPHVSSMQLAFARVKETWEEAYLTNLATHPLASVLERIRTAETVGLFPSESEPPPKIARELLDRGLDHFRAYVCENLGAPDERVTQGELADILDMEFSPLCVMILRCKPGRPNQQRPAGSFRLFGNPDDLFAQSRPKSGLITQSEVRAVALAQLDLHPGSIVWDVGAGSGSVAIEAAQLARPGLVYAIEQDAADYHLVLANAQAFGVTNLKAIHGVAPNVFSSLPAPDAIFVGGTGHEIARLLVTAYQALRPGGKLVTNVATIESLSATYQTLKEQAGSVDVRLISVARGVDQLETVRLESVNPTFLLTIHKPEKPTAKNQINLESQSGRQ
jgi:precorrin-6B C5,15-methyltransferase / cobalt-precorrin-6B C5,C15-methyltransferase